MFVEVIGFLAAFTSTISLIPQVIQMFRTRSVEDISVWMIVNFICTSVLWVVYGIMIASVSVWGANVIMLIFSILMMYFKVRYSSPKTARH